MRSRISILAALAFVTVAAWATFGGVAAQTQQPSGGSLAEVAAEIRLLREAIEANGRTQALAAYATLQQSRIQPLTAELLATRKELDEAARTLRALQQDLASAPPIGDTTADRTIQAMRTAGLRTAESKEAVLRARESDLSSRLQHEEFVWSQLMTQLQQAIRREKAPAPQSN